MKRWMILVVASAGVCACHQRRVVASKTDYAATKAKAQAALDNKEPVQAIPTAAPAAVSAAAPVVDIKRGCSWVESEGTVAVGEAESRAQARAAAVEKAREAALRAVLGVEVEQRSLDFNQEGLKGQTALIENILRTTRRGNILDESPQIEEYRDLGTCRQCAFFVRLKACVKERANNSDRDFKLSLSLPRDRFTEGDEARISAVSTRDAYVYLYDVGMQSETSLLAPNEAVPEVRLQAGKSWEYPDEAARKGGVRLLAQMPAGGVPVSAETVRAIAVKTPLPKSIYEPGSEGYLGVLRRLDASGTQWAEDAAAFAIYPVKAK
jgi:hypothetical protein